MKSKSLLLAICTGATLFGSCDSGSKSPQATPQAAATPSAAVSPKVVGKVLGFGRGGGAHAYLVSGWGKPGKAHTWTEGTSAKMAFPIPSGSGPLLLKMRIAGWTRPPELPFQPVEVYANGEKVAAWEVGPPADFEAPIPLDAIDTGDKLEIELRIPRATSPKAMGIGKDGRARGLLVRTVRLIKAS